jgi:glycosyltransferase involved in cell wall biosynthesis
VIASRVGGLPEAVGDAGVLVPSGDPRALAEAIRRLALDPEARRTLGEAGRRRVAERFTLGAMARGTRAVYRELVPATGAAA